MYTNDSSFSYTNDEQTDHSHQWPQRRKWIREDNKLALYCYYKNNPAKRGYRKRMIGIWTGFARFKKTNQRLADQVKTITKSGWFSDLEILEIHQQIYRQTNQETNNATTETVNLGKPETPKQTLPDNNPRTANTNANTDPRGKRKKN